MTDILSSPTSTGGSMNESTLVSNKVRRRKRTIGEATGSTDEEEDDNARQSSEDDDEYQHEYYLSHTQHQQKKLHSPEEEIRGTPNSAIDTKSGPIPPHSCLPSSHQDYNYENQGDAHSGTKNILAPYLGLQSFMLSYSGATKSNLTLADVGVKLQDPIRIFFTRDPLCHHAPDDLKITTKHLPPAMYNNDDTSHGGRSRSSINNYRSSGTASRRNNTNYEEPVIAIIVPRGQCSIEQKLRNIVSWYQKDHPNVKIAMVYDGIVPDDPIVPQSSLSSPSVTTPIKPTSKFTTSSQMGSTITNNSVQKKRFSPIFSGDETSSHLGTTNTGDSSSSRDEESGMLSSVPTIVTFAISQRTAACLGSLIAAKKSRAIRNHDRNDVIVDTNNSGPSRSEYIEVRFVYHTQQRPGGESKTRARVPKTLSTREQIFYLIEDICMSFIVTVVSIIATAMVLVLCWKDTLSIEITSEGVTILSNVRLIDARTIQDPQEREIALLSAEHVLGFPEVKFMKASSSCSTMLGNVVERANHSPSSSSSLCVPCCTSPISSDSPMTAASTKPITAPSSFDEESPPLTDGPARVLVVKAATTNKKHPVEHLHFFGCNSTCSICLEDFTSDESLRLLPCGHVYHTGCILPWLTKRATSCPLCKKCLCTTCTLKCNNNES